MRRPLHVVVELENPHRRPPLPLFHFFVFSIYQYYFHSLLLLLLIFLFVIVIVSSELLALCDGTAYVGVGLAGGAHGWVVGRAGFWDVHATWVLGSAAPPPGFLATQPPCATQALNMT